MRTSNFEVIRVENVMLILLILAMVRPAFYMISYSYARISDCIFTIIPLFVFLFLNTKNPKWIIIWIFSFISLMTLSLLNASFKYSISIKDFVELFRPFLIVIFFLMGYLYIGHKIVKIENKLNKFFKFVLLLGIIHVSIALFQYFFYGKSKVLYLIYSSINLYEQKRASGIGYTHSEYSLITSFISMSAYSLYILTNKVIYLIFGFILFSLSFLSLSKAGFLISSIFHLLALLFLLKKGSFMYKILYSIFFILLLLSIIYFIITVDYLYHGFKALLELSYTYNKSILNRLEDIIIVKNMFMNTNNPLVFLIGFSPLRNYPEISYIEISILNIFFRFGILGILLYYMIFIFIPIYLFLKLKKIRYKYGHMYDKLKYIYGLCVIFSISVFLGDFLVNASETIKFTQLYSFYIGILYGIIKRKDDSRDCYIY